MWRVSVNSWRYQGIVYVCVCCTLVKWMWCIWGEKGYWRNPVPTLAYSYRKLQRGPPGLTIPSDKRIVINSTYDLTMNALRRDLNFNPGIFRSRNLQLRFCHTIEPNFSSREKLNMSCRWSNSRSLGARQSVTLHKR